MGSVFKASDPVKSLVRLVLFAMNFAFWLVGCAILGIGIWAFVEKNRFAQKEISDLYDVLFDASIILIMVGIAAFIITFAGCVGALRENTCLLMTYTGSLIALLLVGLIGGVLVFIYRGKVQDLVVKFIREEGIVRYRDDPDLQNIFDWMQQKFQCCGVGHRSYHEWSLNPYFNCSESNPSVERCAVPYSCCIHPDNIRSGLINTMCGYGVQRLGILQAAKQVYVAGCVKEMLGVARQNLNTIGIVAVAVTTTQLLGIIFAIFLIRMIKVNAYNRDQPDSVAAFL